MHFYIRLTFILGFFIGLLIDYLLRPHKSTTNDRDLTNPFKYPKYEKFINTTSLTRAAVPLDILRYGTDRYKTEADYLFQTVSLHCLILVKKENNFQAAAHTWSKHCNEVQKVALPSSKKIMPKVGLGANSKRETSWTLLCKSLIQIPPDVDWIVIANDYVFVITENLRYFLAGLDPTDRHYFGHPVTLWGTVYNLGQAGYVLSRGALEALKEKVNQTASCVNTLSYNNKEDYYLGKYFASVNITPTDTRDRRGFSTFNPFNWYRMFSFDDDSYKSSLYPIICCSRFSITFQSTDADKMYTFYYILYNLHVFYGGNLGNRPAKSTTKEDDEVWKKFLTERDLPMNISAELYYQLWVELVDDPKILAGKISGGNFGN